MKLPAKLAVALAAVAITVPTVAQSQPDVPTPAQAYGVICDRPPYDTPRDNVNFSRCVRALAQGVDRDRTAAEAARKACRQADPPLNRKQFGKCVASTKTLVHGLRALKAS